VSAPAQEPSVRTHRVLYPNRRPLLISAILVALTSIPTMIVIAAGTASLHDRDAPRPPAIAGPNGGAVTVGPSAGLREQPSPDGESGDLAHHAVPKASGAGGGQAIPSSGTGRSRLARSQPPAAAPAPATTGASTPGSGSSDSSGSGAGSAGTGADSSGTSSGSSSDDADVGEPEDCPTPSPGKGSSGATQRIDDQAWPGWDEGLTPRS
jgi:hypothetical protein